MQTIKKEKKTIIKTNFQKQRPPQREQGKMIYIGNLSYRRDEKGIRWLFSEFGKVSDIEVIVDLETKKSKGYAFVKMYNSIEALKAVKDLNGKLIDGRTLKVSIAKERENIFIASKPSFSPKTNGQKEKQSINKKDEIQKNRRNRKPKGLDVLKEYLSR